MIRAGHCIAEPDVNEVMHDSWKHCDTVQHFEHLSGEMEKELACEKCGLRVRVILR